MAWMAGYSGNILAVGLLGCARTCRMAQQRSPARLAGVYRATRAHRGHAETPWLMSTGLGVTGAGRRGLAAESFPIARELVR